MRFDRTDVLYRLRHTLCFVVLVVLGGGGWGWEWGGVGVGVGRGGWVGIGKIKTWKIRKSENPKI